jgi:hypothetical protein
MSRYGYDYGFLGRPPYRRYEGDYHPSRGGHPEAGGRFGCGAAWGGFRRMNELERYEGVPERIARATREGRVGYGGYPGPRRSPAGGRYDLNYRQGYDRGW